MAYGLTALQIVQQFCKRTGLPQPTTLTNLTDPGTLQIVGLLDEVQEDLMVWEWQGVKYQCSWQTVAAADGVQGNIDTICGLKVKSIINDTLWDQTTRLPVFGPVSPQRWEQYKALPITGTLLQYRILQDQLVLYPFPSPAAHSLIFEVMGQYMVIDPTTTPLPTFKRLITKDTDVFPIQDQVLLAGLRWKYKREKGLAYEEDKQRWSMLLADAQERDGTARILNMASDDENFGPGILVPSGSWNINSTGNLPGAGS